MKAEELRIGNIVSYKGEPARVTMIGQYGIQALGTDNVINAKFGTPDIESIPLTPEILEKAGFVKDGSHYMINSIENDGLGRLNIGFYAPNGIMEQFQICQYMEGVGIGSIKYVHQLQNLYFSLVGSELPINL